MLEPALLLFVVLAPHSAVYVKGHSRAAARARERLQALTCYSPATVPEASVAVLEVDHLLSGPGDRSVAMVFVDSRGKVLWESKAREDPLPFLSPVNRLLKRLAKSTCREPALSAAEKATPIPAK
jgi:hypothetical protein